MASLPTTMILLSLLFSVMLYANARAVDHLVSTLNQTSEFDFYTLALQWPATFCSTHENKCCPENGCCVGENSKPPPGFTIHGLWPDYNDGTWPSCCEGPPFDEEQLEPLLSAMHMYWPILSCNDVSSCNNEIKSFWADQWAEHGACAYFDPYEYFLTALKLYFKYNVTDVLLQANFKPSNSETYISDDIISAIENAFHARPQLICKNYDVIKEIRLCFTKDLQIRDCVVPSLTCVYNVHLPEFAFIGGTKTEDWLISAVKSVV